jgi:superfamily II DNA/RNA helicase
LVDSLKRGGFAVSQIHGDMDQSDRIRELDRFKSGDINIIVASDVAARGPDIPGVSHVVNYDVPHHAEDYVHRIGRTGRAGRTGIAYTLMTEAEAENLAEVEKLIHQKIPRYGDAPAVVLQPVDIVLPLAAVDEPRGEAPDDAGDVGNDTTVLAPAGDRPRKRRRGGRGRKRDGGDDAAAPAPRAAEPTKAPREEPRGADVSREAPRKVEAKREEPRREEPRREEPRRTGRDTRNDPIRAYRGDRSREPRRDDRRDREDGESFIGFGPEGIPEFLMHKATIIR